MGTINEFLKRVGVGKNIFLLDSSWLNYRAFYAYNKVDSSTGEIMGMGIYNGDEFQPTGHVYGVLRTIQSINEWDATSIIVLCLDGYPKERIDVIHSIGGSEYKEGRAKLVYNIRKDMDDIASLSMYCPNCYVAQNPDLESDDLMFALAKRVTKEGKNKAYIYSGDNDLLQAIDENISVVRVWNNGPVPITTESLKVEKSFDKFKGTRPECLPFFRTLCGDKSDRLVGIPRFPKVLAKRIAETVSSIEDFKHISTVVSYSTPTELKYLHMVEDDYDRLNKLYHVMVLRDDIECEIVRTRSKDIQSLLEKYKLHSYTRFLKSKLETK